MRKLLSLLACILALSFTGHALAARGLSPVATPTNTGNVINFPSKPTGTAGLSQTATGVAVGGTVAAPLGLGKVLSIAATGAIGGLEVAGAWGAAIGGVGALAIAAIPQIKGMMDRAKIRRSSDGVLEAEDPNSCSVAPCYQYSLNATNIFGEGKSTGWQPSLVAATSMMTTLLSSGSIQYVFQSCDASQCSWRYEAGNHTAWSNITKNNVEPSPPSYVPITIADGMTRISANAPTTAEVQALIDAGFPPQVTPVSTSGQPSTFMGNTVSLGVDGAKTTEATTINHTYFPGFVGNSRVKTTTVETPAKTTTATDANGAVTTIVTPAKTTTNTTTDAENDPAAAQAQAKAEADANAETACGLPGSPACKIDETGTPGAATDAKYTPKLDKAKTDQDGLRETAGGSADKGFFANWQSFFVTPPLATCQVYELPNSIGSINPCPVVDGVRSFMAFLWAITALWAGIKMVREVI